jgi:hypothetical protein
VFKADVKILYSYRAHGGCDLPTEDAYSSYAPLPMHLWPQCHNTLSILKKILNSNIWVWEWGSWELCKSLHTFKSELRIFSTYSQVSHSVTQIFELRISLRILKSFMTVGPVFLAHLSWKLKWAFLIAGCPFICLSVCKLLHFRLFLQNHWTNFNQTWQKSSLGRGDWILFKGRG